MSTWHIQHRNTIVSCTVHTSSFASSWKLISSHGPKQIAPPLLPHSDSFNCLFLLTHSLKYKQDPRLTTLESSQFASSCAIFGILQYFFWKCLHPHCETRGDVTSLPVGGESCWSCCELHGIRCKVTTPPVGNLLPGEIIGETPRANAEINQWPQFYVK